MKNIFFISLSIIFALTPHLLRLCPSFFFMLPNWIFLLSLGKLPKPAQRLLRLLNHWASVMVPAVIQVRQHWGIPASQLKLSLVFIH